MAQLKNLIVTGAARIIGKLNATSIAGDGSEITNINAGNISSGTLPVGRGGTGATDASNARANLGITPANIGAATASHNQASNTINAMTGYSKASSIAAISTSDSLNTAIGKLEKTLDNKQNAGSYAASSHTHDDRYYTETEIDTKLSGKANSSHGTHVPSTCTSISDWDSATTNGWYMGSNISNQPVANGGWFYGVTIVHNTNYIRQIAWHFATDNSVSGTNCDKYERVKHNGTWGTWVNTSVHLAVPSDAKFTDTNTWRPLGTTADTACAGNDSRLSNARPASDVYSWAKASTKPTYTWDEITSKPSTFTPASHTHSIIDGTYTQNGGSQPPSYIASGKVRFNMMNAFEGLSNLPTYADCLLMDTYTGSDVPYVTGLGIIKASGNPRAYIAVGAKGNTTTWTSQAELITTANISSQSVNYANSAGNSDTLDSYHGSSSQTANTYVLRDANGYIYTNYINSNTSNNENPTISQIVVTNGDNFYRKASLGHLKSSLGTMPPSEHTHSYAGSSSAGGAANSLAYFKNTSTTDVGIDDTSANAIGYVSGTSSILSQNDGAMYKQVYSSSWVHEIYGDYRTGQIAVRGKNNGTWQAWRTILDSSNYTSYTVTKTGGGASGTWGINVSGNASTATKLATARTIALTGSVTGSGTFDGSGNLSIATTTNHTHSYAGSSSAGGSANSAVKLDSNAGSATQPIYFSGGKPTACSYTLSKSVPSDAKFTDTTYSTGTESTSGLTKLYTVIGTATDGTMTQNAITTELNKKSKVTIVRWS